MSNGEILRLRRAVAAAPDDVALRLQLAELLLQHGRTSEAVQEAAEALGRDPDSADARALMARAVVGTPDSAKDPFDWGEAERQFEEVSVPLSVESVGQGEDVAPFDVEESGVRLEDVGGMEQVKARLEAAFLAPMRNPDLQDFYGKSLRGGLLLYGPPGCGKTFLARAVAGELSARFLNVSLVDVLDMWFGVSERNLHEVFELARRRTPCVVFLDEVDALGQKRAHLRSSGMRTMVNQLLEELDGARSANDGVFVLAATNQPWDVDPALRRPGRFDRTVLVLPPDEPARAAILSRQVERRPAVGIDVAALAGHTDGFSGADLVHLCETAAEKALLDSIRTGTKRRIEMADFLDALREVRPSTGAWFDSARNVATFANQHGEYDGVLEYLNRNKRRR